MRSLRRNTHDPQREREREKKKCDSDKTLVYYTVTLFALVTGVVRKERKKDDDGTWCIQ